MKCRYILTFLVVLFTYKSLKNIYVRTYIDVKKIYNKIKIMLSILNYTMDPHDTRLESYCEKVV